MTGVEILRARHYRLPTASAWFIRAFLVSCLLVGALGLLDNKGGTFGLVGGARVHLHRHRDLDLGRASDRAGIYEAPDGLRAVRVPGSSFARWQSIEAFEASSAWPRSRVIVVATNGHRVPLIGTAQGARIVWDDGETQDIAGVLNERLPLWKAAEGRDASRVE